MFLNAFQVHALGASQAEEIPGQKTAL